MHYQTGRLRYYFSLFPLRLFYFLFFAPPVPHHATAYIISRSFTLLAAYYFHAPPIPPSAPVVLPSFDTFYQRRHAASDEPERAARPRRIRPLAHAGAALATACRRPPCAPSAKCAHRCPATRLPQPSEPQPLDVTFDALISRQENSARDMPRATPREE